MVYGGDGQVVKETVFCACSKHKPIAVCDMFTCTSIAHLPFTLRIVVVQRTLFSSIDSDVGVVCLHIH